MKLTSKLSIAGVLSLTLPALFATDVMAKGKRGVATNTTSTTSSSTPLDSTEVAHLTFMREEEKLARDVYLTFAAMYSQQRVFANIATKSEQTHTDTMLDKLEQYNVKDPNPDTNNLDESLGVFTGEQWGEYFTEKFNMLVTKGEASELAALYTGAYIEELDMNDIVVCPEVIVEAGYGKADEKGVIQCALNYTDESGLINAYNFLIDGSENHLRAYVGQIEAVIGECEYKAQYLSQLEVDDILNRTCSRESESESESEIMSKRKSMRKSKSNKNR